MSYLRQYRRCERSKSYRGILICFLTSSDGNTCSSLENSFCRFLLHSSLWEVLCRTISDHLFFKERHRLGIVWWEIFFLDIRLIKWFWWHATPWLAISILSGTTVVPVNFWNDRFHSLEKSVINQSTLQCAKEKNCDFYRF